MTITEFLAARYDEAEAVADRILLDQGTGDLDSLRAEVLADIAAKRAIVALHSAPDGSDPSCSSIVYPESAEDCETLLALLQPYAEHPDCDPAWRV